MRLVLAALLLLVAGCSEAHPRDYAVRLDIARGPTMGVCSGTAVGPNIVLTASHCFGVGQYVKAINGQQGRVLEVVHDGKDHALIRVTVTFKRWAEVRPGMHQGQRIKWLGNPGGLANMYREGYVSKVEGGTAYIFADGWFGDSGAGLFDERGYVVGVLSGAQARSSNGLRIQIIGAYQMQFTAEQWQEIRA